VRPKRLIERQEIITEREAAEWGRRFRGASAGVKRPIGLIGVQRRLPLTGLTCREIENRP